MFIPEYLYTIPFWHKYTGPRRHSKDFKLPGVSWLDDVSKQHDKDCRGGSEWLLGVFKSTKTSRQNIKADGVFIINYLFYATSSIVVNIQKMWDPSILYVIGIKTDINIFARIGLAVGQTVVDLIVGAFGCCIFVLNIILNGANIVGRIILRK